MTFNNDNNDAITSYNNDIDNENDHDNDTNKITLIIMIMMMLIRSRWYSVHELSMKTQDHNIVVL